MTEVWSWAVKMNNPLFILFNVVVNFALWLFLLRFLLQFAAVDKKHPYAAVIYRLTAISDLFAHILPNKNKGRINTAILVLMLLLWLLGAAGSALILGKQITAIELFFKGTVSGLLMFLTALKWTILASIVCSFIVLLSQRIHPVIDIIMQLSEPLIEPFRKITPELGMIDLAPLVAMLSFSLATMAIQIVAKELWFMTF